VEQLTDGIRIGGQEAAEVTREKGGVSRWASRQVGCLEKGRKRGKTAQTVTKFHHLQTAKHFPQRTTFCTIHAASPGREPPTPLSLNHFRTRCIQHNPSTGSRHRSKPASPSDQTPSNRKHNHGTTTARPVPSSTPSHPSSYPRHAEPNVPTPIPSHRPTPNHPTITPMINEKPSTLRATHTSTLHNARNVSRATATDLTSTMLLCCRHPRWPDYRTQIRTRRTNHIHLSRHHHPRLPFPNTMHQPRDPTKPN